MKVFISPHNDDETLFGAFTIQHEQPIVVVVFDSEIQFRRGHSQCNAAARRFETITAMAELGLPSSNLVFAGISDSSPDLHSVLQALCPYVKAERVWAPLSELGGHDHHNLVSAAAKDIWGNQVLSFYSTYTSSGKSMVGREVPFTGEMLWRKIKALACYRTQIITEALGCYPHFIRDQREFVVKGNL